MGAQSDSADSNAEDVDDSSVRKECLGLVISGAYTKVSWQTVLADCREATWSKAVYVAVQRGLLPQELGAT
eukprot:5364907-Amphidinium_carterae.1